MALQKLSHSFTKIGFKPLQTTVRHILYSLSFSLFCIFQITAQETNKTTEVPIPAERDSISARDTITNNKEKIKVDSELLLNEREQDTTDQEQ